MEQTVKVVSCHADGTARVVHIRQSACSGDCHQCSGCGAVKQPLYLTAQNPIGARVGDRVRLESRSAPVLLGAAVLYILPLILFLVGYLLGKLTWGVGIWTGLVGFALAVVAAVAYDRLILKKRETVYTITGYAQ